MKKVKFTKSSIGKADLLSKEEKTLLLGGGKYPEVQQPQDPFCLAGFEAVRTCHCQFGLVINCVPVSKPCSSVCNFVY